jgi:hypothetical protein
VVAARAFVPANNPKAIDMPTAKRRTPATHPGMASAQFETFLRQDLEKSDTNFRQVAFKYMIGSTMPLLADVGLHSIHSPMKALEYRASEFTQPAELPVFGWAVQARASLLLL